MSGTWDLGISSQFFTISAAVQCVHAFSYFVNCKRSTQVPYSRLRTRCTSISLSFSLVLLQHHAINTVYLQVTTVSDHAGMWYHLSLFLDADELGVAYAGVTTATALSQVIGGPLAAVLLLLDGKFGLHGWQWLFICEGIPTVIFAIFLKVNGPGYSWMY